MKFEVLVVLEKTTARTFLMQQLVEDETQQVIRSMYLERAALEAAGIKKPTMAKVTIEIDI